MSPSENDCFRCFHRESSVIASATVPSPRPAAGSASGFVAMRQRGGHSFGCFGGMGGRAGPCACPDRPRARRTAAHAFMILR